MMVDEELKKDIFEYYRMKEYKKLLEKEMRKIRERILERLPENCEINVAEYNVKVTSYTRTVVNLEALKLFLGEKFDSFVTEKKVRRVIVDKIEK